MNKKTKQGPPERGATIRTLAHSGLLLSVLFFAGPWFIGEMTGGHLGALFVHGMYLKQHWIPGSLSYYYGLMQVRAFR